ncbi:MAG: PP0621 family protein [Hydrogenophaga sp.]
MKYLLVLAVLVVAFWIWRNNRRSDSRPEKQPTPPPIGLPLTMVACLECGTHLPESEALRGDQGSYCCAEHRRQHERAST